MGQSTRDSETIEEAIELLQQLGLKEYEARCFVGLSRLETGTAKQLSQLTEVPRTRVYDAIRVLETKGLVNTQHSSPKQFRAVPIDEGIETLRDQYEDRFERLQHAIATVDTVEQTGDSPLQEVWTMVGRTGIENRTNDLIDNATTEVVFVVGDESLLTEDLTATLNGIGNGVDLLIGATTPPIESQIQSAVPSATTFISGLEWLHGSGAAENETAIGRLVLIDRSAFIVSSIMPESKDEQAIVGEGFQNGLVVIARRLMAQGLLTAHDPGQ